VTRRPIPAIWLVLAGIASVQLGAAVAKDLFGRIDPTAMVWLRLATSSWSSWSSPDPAPRAAAATTG
jgi:inner membrane transporter RhtA